MAWIRTIEWGEADGDLLDAYNWQAASLGEPAEFTMLGSLYPAIVEERLRLYRAVEKCESGLSPIERQMACYVTSLLNGTSHCASGLRLKLETLGAPVEVLDDVASRPGTPRTGDDRLDAVMAHAAKLTLTPTEMTEADLAELRSHGLSDIDILDLNNLSAYYNYINRVVNGLGLRSVMTTTHEATNALPADAT
jgi:uncharacterized peroxidase-related enzyme